MPKVVYETTQLRYEVQQAIQQEQTHLNGVTENVVMGWTSLRRYSDQRDAVTNADDQQLAYTLEKYRVVDTFAASEDDNG